MPGAKKSPKTPRIPLTLTPEMRQAVEKIAEERGAPLASVIRSFIRDGLEREGYTLTERVTWGRTFDNSNAGEAEDIPGNAVAV